MSWTACMPSKPTFFHRIHLQLFYSAHCLCWVFCKFTLSYKQRLGERYSPFSRFQMLLWWSHGPGTAQLNLFNIRSAMRAELTANIVKLQIIWLLVIVIAAILSQQRRARGGANQWFFESMIQRKKVGRPNHGRAHQGPNKWTGTQGVTFSVCNASPVCSSREEAQLGRLPQNQIILQSTAVSHMEPGQEEGCGT